MKVIGASILVLAGLTLLAGIMEYSWCGNAEADSLENDVFPICTADDEQMNPAVHGNIVVWEDERNSFTGDIYLYDLLTSEERMFSNNSRSDEHPDIYDNTIVWQFGNDSYEDQIVMQNLDGELVNISVVADNDEMEPKIDGDYIVWYYSEVDSQTYNTTHHFVSYRISTGETELETLTLDPSLSNEFGFVNGRIVWVDFLGGETGFLTSKVIVYNIFTNQVEVEMDIGGWSACLTDDFLTYSEQSLSSRPSIMEMNLLTKEKRKVVSLDDVPQDLDRYGDLIVWCDDRNSILEDGFTVEENVEIFLYDVQRGIETQITSSGGEKEDARIHGNYIVWVTGGMGEEDIYGYDLSTDSNNNGVADYIDKGRKVGPDGSGGDDDDSDTNTFLIAGAGIGILVIIVVVMVFRSRSQEDEEYAEGGGDQGEQYGAQQYQAAGYGSQGDQYQGAPPTGQTGICPNCNQQVRYIPEYQRYYCDYCQNYI